jgi:hypothetical protein
MDNITRIKALHDDSVPVFIIVGSQYVIVTAHNQATGILDAGVAHEAIVAEGAAPIVRHWGDILQHCPPPEVDEKTLCSILQRAGAVLINLAILAGAPAPDSSEN